MAALLRMSRRLLRYTQTLILAGAAGVSKDSM
jgi:hypothetical protein